MVFINILNIFLLPIYTNKNTLFYYIPCFFVIFLNSDDIFNFILVVWRKMSYNRYSLIYILERIHYDTYNHWNSWR